MTSLAETAPGADTDARKTSPLVRLVSVAVVTLAVLYSAFLLYVSSQALFGAVLLALAVGIAIVFGLNRFYAFRFIFPGVAAVVMFILFPVVYTVYLGFTNYSSFNLLTYERSVEVLMSRHMPDLGSEVRFAVAADGDMYRIWLPESGLLSGPIALAADAPAENAAMSAAAEPANLLAPRDALALRAPLQKLTVVLPDGTILQNSGLRTFAVVAREYERIAENQLRRISDGAVLTADHDRGFFVTSDGETVPPGWRVFIGTTNFERIFNSSGIRDPMLSIFVWTFAFATLTVVFTFALGLALASVLQWPHLSFKPVYRILLILPYAVPAFISILVFRGLFNQNFGEINLILEMLFGARPQWFSDGNLAKVMIIIVNTWLGYPYMMLLAMGFLQAVPEDHKKAAALEGAGMLRVFFTITLPQILPPFLPLLIASFAFNFNNVVLILLLTRGLPDIPGTIIPAGQTDIVASFTYRIAFSDSAQQFGLAGAITLLIFIVVGVISYANFVTMRRAAEKRGAPQ